MSVLDVSTSVDAVTERPAPAAAGRLQHLSGLDGLRGVAVIAVLLFHGGFSWAKGGWLGVSVFFTLSGFLITSLLLKEWQETGTVSLRGFWSRRFRRLLPAALACLVLVALYGWLEASPEQLRHLRGDMLAALGYAANWRFVLRDLSYADLFSAPSPVQHFWSLAIEEQFYLAYPLVVLGLLRFGGRRALAWCLAMATVASVIWGLHITELDRVYYGTDTRMAELLVGGLLAFWWTRPRKRQVSRQRGVVTLGGIVGLLGTGALVVLVAEDSEWVTGGALPLQALLSVLALWAAIHAGPVARLLSVRPLVAIGAVSYGLYLYHWPVFLVLDEQRVELDGIKLFVLRMAVTTTLALLSFHLLEQPVRRRRILLTIRSAGAALATGVAIVLAVSLAVTASPPATAIAHAGVDLDDQTAEVISNEPSSPVVVAPTATPAPEALMIIGDSGTYDLAPALSSLYTSLGTKTIVDVSWPGFGLARENASWDEEWPRLVADHDPRLVVVLQGGWDANFLKAEGAAAYDAVLDRAVAVLGARGARILWLSPLPGSGADTGPLGPRYASLARRHPGVVAHADVSRSLTGPDGERARWLPNEVGELELARKPDGWHLCPSGAVRLARAIGEQAARLGWGPAPAAGWENGDWRTNERYDDPPGGCDPSRPENRPEG